MVAKFKREFLRAPFPVEILYILDGDVLKARGGNICEGGILIDGLPKPPDDGQVICMTAIPQYPDFSLIEPTKVLSIKFQELDQKVFRLRGKVVRASEGVMKGAERIYLTKVACHFFEVSTEAKLYIRDYVNRYCRNLVYLLGLFEGKGLGNNRTQVIRHLSELLGYDSYVPMAQVRLKALHDYQSLESL